jgi:hypothetical protein
MDVEKIVAKSRKISRQPIPKKWSPSNESQKNSRHFDSNGLIEKIQQQLG